MAPSINFFCIFFGKFRGLLWPLTRETKKFENAKKWSVESNRIPKWVIAHSWKPQNGAVLAWKYSSRNSISVVQVVLELLKHFVQGAFPYGRRVHKLFGIPVILSLCVLFEYHCYYYVHVAIRTAFSECARPYFNLLSI